MMIRGAKGKLGEREVVYLAVEGGPLRSAEEAFKLLDGAGCDIAFVEYESVEEYLDGMAYVPSKQLDKMKAAQLVGMREVVCWQQGAIWALPNWTWRVAYMKAPAAVPVATVNGARPRG
jgi:hypothetical protein